MEDKIAWAKELLAQYSNLEFRRHEVTIDDESLGHQDGYDHGERLAQGGSPESVPSELHTGSNDYVKGFSDGLRAYNEGSK